MAVLHNDARNLRFTLELVDRETLPPVPGQKPPALEAMRVRVAAQGWPVYVPKYLEKVELT